ncbi:hypothetical protein [Candidatus Enterovibrio altilux]|nr:hypothetical protein [Candidatus Enterovibrio luxaltus]
MSLRDHAIQISNLRHDKKLNNLTGLGGCLKRKRVFNSDSC